jgi:hypothetical protein
MLTLYFQVSSLQRSANYNLSTIGEDKTQYHESNTTYINDSYTNIEGNMVEDKFKKIKYTYSLYLFVCIY